VFTSLKNFRDDLTAHPPDHFVCVPLVLDTLYNKVGMSRGRGLMVTWHDEYCMPPPDRLQCDLCRATDVRFAPDVLLPLSTSCSG
jgi:hypothetical protein